MANLNRSLTLRSVNRSLAERQSSVRVRFDSEYLEFQVTYPVGENREFAPAASLTDAIYTAIALTEGN